MNWEGALESTGLWHKRESDRELIFGPEHLRPVGRSLVLEGKGRSGSKEGYTNNPRGCQIH